MNKKITKDYIITKANQIVESVIKNGTNRSEDIVFTHSIVGLLAEAYYNYFINKNAIKKETPYYDFYDENENLKIEVKTISYSAMKTSNYIKVGNYKSIQQKNPKFDIMEFIVLLKPAYKIKNHFLNGENDELKNSFKYIGYVNKDDLLKYRFKSKYNNFYYVSKYNFNKIIKRRK